MFSVTSTMDVIFRYCLFSQILNSIAVRDTLSMMNSCGLYNYSGMFAFKVNSPLLYLCLGFSA